jgi:hypothetical protein
MYSTILIVTDQIAQLSKEHTKLQLFIIECVYFYVLYKIKFSPKLNCSFFVLVDSFDIIHSSRPI